MRINSPHMNIIYKACMKASKSLIRDFGEIENLQVSSKGPGDFVSSADKRTEKIIIEELLKAHPDYCTITEESGVLNNENKERKWIVDPIDGTMNFLNGIPHFAMSVAFEEKNEIVCGMVFNPITKEIFFAEKGNGAFLNNTRIRVSKKNNFKSSLIATGGPKKNSKIKNLIFDEYIKISNILDTSIRKYGSAALELASVACGRLDGYWQRELNYWDVAAGIIILKEAGGYCNFFQENNKNPLKCNIIASNSLIHKELESHTLKKNIE